jgi:ribosomal protein S18 acetylase RimI-like enzyme
MINRRNPGNIEVRVSELHDVPFLTDCFLRSLRDTITACRGGWDEADNRSRFEAQLDLSSTQVIQRETGETVGFLIAVESAGEIQLHTLCISPEHQGNGIGTLITQGLIEKSKATGRDLVLDVMKANDGARRLYERLGFVVVQDFRHHVHMRFSAAR